MGKDKIQFFFGNISQLGAELYFADAFLPAQGSGNQPGINTVATGNIRPEFTFLAKIFYQIMADGIHAAVGIADPIAIKNLHQRRSKKSPRQIFQLVPFKLHQSQIIFAPDRQSHLFNPLRLKSPFLLLP